MKENPDRILAIHPITSGFGWILFDGSASPIDWDTAKTRDRRDRTVLTRIEALLAKLQPAELVMEDAGAEDSNRKSRIRRVWRKALELADTKMINTAVYSRGEISACFAKEGARTRYEIATAIAGRIPELAHLLPPKRKIWLAENPRMGLFDAAAVGVTHYWHKSKG